MGKRSVSRVQFAATRLGVAVALVAGTVMWFATAGSAADHTVRAVGSSTFVPDGKVSSNLRWSPGPLTVKSGDSLTLVHASDPEPHTFTIVNAADVPTNVNDVFNCGSPGTICDTVFSIVGPQIVDQNAAQFVDVNGTGGLSGRVDTVYLPPGTSITVPVTAPAGTTLHYMCVIHAWMQGTIAVKG